MGEIYYGKTHEYLKKINGKYHLGISEYAAEELGDITYVELPEVGKEFKRGEVVATIESVKAVGECYAPVDLKVVGVNDELADTPEKINEDPLGDGYIAEVEVLKEEQIKELLTKEQYDQMEKEH